MYYNFTNKLKLRLNVTSVYRRLVLLKSQQKRENFGIYFFHNRCLVYVLRVGLKGIEQ